LSFLSYIFTLPNKTLRNLLKYIYKLFILKLDRLIYVYLIIIKAGETRTWTYNLKIFNFPLYQIEIPELNLILIYVYYEDILIRIWISDVQSLIYYVQSKIWTYNLNSVSILLYQIELLELNKKFLEILGFEPKITICKIAVLPIKLYSLNYFINPYPKNDKHCTYIFFYFYARIFLIKIWLHKFYGLIAIIFIDIIETSKLNAPLSNIIIIFDKLAMYAINNKRTITITI
jgi:hypothetical protein